jgi:hypothetical protein
MNKDSFKFDPTHIKEEIFQERQNHDEGVQTCLSCHCEFRRAGFLMNENGICFACEKEFLAQMLYMLAPGQAILQFKGCLKKVTIPRAVAEVLVHQADHRGKPVGMVNGDGI